LRTLTDLHEELNLIEVGIRRYTVSLKKNFGNGIHEQTEIHSLSWMQWMKKYKLDSKKNSSSQCSLVEHAAGLKSELIGRIP
jgi:hypothetical protein